MLTQTHSIGQSAIVVTEVKIAIRWMLLPLVLITYSRSISHPREIKTDLVIIALVIPLVYAIVGA